MISPPEDEHRKPGAASRDANAEEGYLLAEMAVEPPLEEFRRLFAKKLRSFESDAEGEDTGQVESYRKAFALGEAKILDRLYG